MVILPPMSTTMNMEVIKNPKGKLPSLRSVYEEWTMAREDHRTPVLETSDSPRHHYRTMSLPTTLPSNRPVSYSENQFEQSSMDILLKAIALDQKMNVVYKNERVKSFVREQQWLHKTQASPNLKHRNLALSLRRRSKSAPGAPVAHYYQNVALNSTRWYLPNHGEYESHRISHDIAYALVQQHLKYASSIKM